MKNVLGGGQTGEQKCPRSILALHSHASYQQN
jgi:hypothetical protein